MASVKYGVYFYGNEHERDSLCFYSRDVFLSTSREHAENYCKELQDTNPAMSYKVCVLVVDDA